MTDKKIKNLALIAVMTAIMCILGPLSVPIGPVPLSLTTFAVFLSVFILGWKRGTLSVCVYLLLGLAGLPVFSGFQGGIAKLAGPTGGYLIGFIPVAILAGIIIESCKRRLIISIIGMAGLSWLLYTIGTTWLAFSMHISWGQALAAGVLPFIVGDIIKIICAALLGKAIFNALMRANVMQYE